MQAKYTCNKHNHNLTCLCMEDNCINRKLCETCLSTHTSSHRGSFIYFDEIIDGLLIDEILSLESKLTVNNSLLEEYFNNLQDLMMKKIVEAKKEAKKRLDEAYCMKGINSNSLQKCLTKLKENGLEDSDIEEFHKIIKPHINFRKKSDQESGAILSLALKSKIGPVILKATDMHFEGILETIIPKTFDSVSIPATNLQRLKSMERNVNVNMNIQNVISDIENIVFDTQNIPKPPISESELFERRQNLVIMTFEDPNGAVYEGETFNGIKEGYGVISYMDGSKYEGEFFNGKSYGKGKLYHSDGDIYEGGFKDEVATGFGIYTHTDGAQYKGMWLNDKQEGHGIETWPDGAKYTGTYSNGKKQGAGEFRWSDGSQYNGSFLENNIDGYGVYIWADGRCYKGQWKVNKMEGHGEFTWIDGRKYIGNYQGDKKEGLGKFFWPDGRNYDGQWVNGKQHGEGVYTAADGSKKKGIWEDGKRIRWI